jgi:hypothetical protein
MQPFRQIANPGYWQYLSAHVSQPTQPEIPPELIEEAGAKANHLVDGMVYLDPSLQYKPEVATGVQQSIKALLTLPLFEQKHPFPGSRSYPKAMEFIRSGLALHAERWPVFFTWAFLSNLDSLSPDASGDHHAISWMDEWQLNKVLMDAFRSSGSLEQAAAHQTALVRLLLLEEHWYSKIGAMPLASILENWLSTDEIRYFLNINRHKDVLWFNKEAFEEFLWWMMVLALLEIAGSLEATATQTIENILGAYDIVQKLTKAEKDSEYQVNQLLTLVRKG